MGNINKITGARALRAYHFHRVDPQLPQLLPPVLVSLLLASAKPSFSVVAPSADPPSPGGTLENMCNPKVEMPN